MKLLLNDFSFIGNKLDVVYKNKRFFGESQPSLILKQVCDLDKVSVLHQPTEIILILSIPLCDKQVNTCCYKNVLFKIFIENKPSTTETVYIKFNLSDELKLF